MKWRRVREWWGAVVDRFGEAGGRFVGGCEEGEEVEDYCVVVVLRGVVEGSVPVGVSGEGGVGVVLVGG